MKIGTYYYPEQWPREQWKRDFDNIVEMGLQIVHMAEFAWFEMEPTPGDIRLDWLAHCVEMAADRKLDVILFTPTAAPPIWLAAEIWQLRPICAQLPISAWESTIVPSSTYAPTLMNIGGMQVTPLPT